MRIYVASSWRNDIQPDVVKALRAAGHEVYDFKNPREGDKGFHWSEIDKDWKQWTPEKYRECLNHPVACAGFKSDFDAMEWAECFVGVQPFGRSASMEMGYGAAAGKLTILLLNSGEPELMVKMFDHICCSLGEVIEIVGAVEMVRDTNRAVDDRLANGLSEDPYDDDPGEYPSGCSDYDSHQQAFNRRGGCST